MLCLCFSNATLRGLETDVTHGGSYSSRTFYDILIQTPTTKHFNTSTICRYEAVVFHFYIVSPRIS